MCDKKSLRVSTKLKTKYRVHKKIKYVHYTYTYVGAYMKTSVKRSKGIVNQEKTSRELRIKTYVKEIW